MKRTWPSFFLASLFIVFNALTVHAQYDADFTAKHLDAWTDFYRDLHANPELSFQEEQTAIKLAEYYRKLGIEVTTGVGKTGVVGVIKNGAGPTLMFRTDMDGLPVVEQTGVEYASKKRMKDVRGTDVGVMHACAHDIHMTCQTAAAEYLVQHRKQWSGTIVLVCQPAEEVGRGASAMIADGLLVRFPRPDHSVALHVGADLEVGKIGYRAGYLMASVDSVDIVIHGKGGHGAFPHKTIDPIVQAAHLILDIQSLVSRENNPTDPAVITVGSIHGGTKHNIIDDVCKLQLTVRSYDPIVRQKLLDGIARKAKAAALSAGADEPEITVSDPTPATRNDPALVQRLVPHFKSVLGADNVIEVEPVMGGEDYSQFGLAGIPIAMFRLGVISPERFKASKENGAELPSLHSAKFYPDPRGSIEIGTKVLVTSTLELLPPK